MAVCAAAPRRTFCHSLSILPSLFDIRLCQSFEAINRAGGHGDVFDGCPTRCKTCNLCGIPALGRNRMALNAKTSSPTAANNNSARNSFTNALANRGKGVTSAGAAVSTARETMIPLATVSHIRLGYAPLFVNHQGLLVASTISFNLQPGSSLGQAADEINRAIARIDMPASIYGTFAGTTQLFQESLARSRCLSSQLLP